MDKAFSVILAPWTRLCCLNCAQLSGLYGAFVLPISKGLFKMWTCDHCGTNFTRKLSIIKHIQSETCRKGWLSAFCSFVLFVDFVCIL